MTAADPKKVFKQLEKKPAKLEKFKKHNISKPRSYGASTKKCRLCGRVGRGHISKYRLDLCRQCFRDKAKILGFKKFGWGKKMSLNDPLANTLSAVLNNEKTGKMLVNIKPISNTIKKVLDVLKANGYIASTKETEDGKGNYITITLSGNINKCGAIKPRYAGGKKEFEKFERRFLPAKGFGIIIVSTPQGIMTNEEAKEKQIGGRLLAYCY